MGIKVKLVCWISLLLLMCSDFVQAKQTNKSGTVDEDENSHWLKMDTFINNTNTFYLHSLIEEFTLFAGKESTLTFGYNFMCMDVDSMVIEYRSLQTDVFNIEGEHSFQMPCQPRNNVMRNDNDSLENQSLSTNINGTSSVTVRGHSMGISDLHIVVHTVSLRTGYDKNQSESFLAEIKLPVSVLRLIRPIDKLFLIIIPFFLITVTVGFGCKLDLEVVKECIKKPVAPGIGFGCQYILMPLLGFTVAVIAPTGDRGVSLGIFLCGICPGGGVSNIYTYLLGGDVSLSITLTFLSTLASMAMMPFWIYTLGRVFTDGYTELHIPFLNLLQITAMLTCSLLVGVFIKLKCRPCAKVFIKILKPFTIICMITLITIAIISNIYIFKMLKPVHLLYGCLLPYCGYLIGGSVAALLRQPWSRVKTIAIETGLQNVGVAYLLLIQSFKPPAGDIAALAPLASGVMTPLPLMVVTITYLVYKRCTRKHDVEKNKDLVNRVLNEGLLLDDQVVVTEKLSTV